MPCILENTLEHQETDETDTHPENVPLDTHPWNWLVLNWRDTKWVCCDSDSPYKNLRKFFDNWIRSCHSHWRVQKMNWHYHETHDHETRRLYLFWQLGTQPKTENKVTQLLRSQFSRTFQRKKSSSREVWSQPKIQQTHVLRRFYTLENEYGTHKWWRLGSDDVPIF